ncbi:MAG: hypothetical protein A49_03750 [Methyloceanibacter sp.]|nr:MAG: hypothetical protein A49_03750 [Methyloceanibacter sp.]
MPEQAHATLSASGAVRWMSCPGSVRLEAALPEETSTYAEEGTVAHEVAAQCLRGGTNADSYLDETFFVKDGNVVESADGADRPYTVDQEMVDAVQMYLDYVRQQPGTLLVEQRVDFSPWVPDGFGTADAIILHDGGAAVVDLKYGRGVPVYAEENPQTMLYALGALNEFGFAYEIDTFKLVIVQPRLDHIDDDWEVSYEKLENFGAWANKCAERALADDAPLTPSTKACQFCKARGSCKALAEHVYKTACDGFEAIGGPVEVRDQALLTPAERSALLNDLDILTGYADAVIAETVAMLMRGETVPGFKLVEGRSNRKWADEEAAGKALARKLGAKVAFIKKLITITDAEKRLGKNDPLVAKHTTKPPGKPTLAPESSPKPALKFDPADGFDDLEEAA